MIRRSIAIVAAVLATVGTLPGQQSVPPGTANLKLVAHMPLGGGFSVGDIEIEQDRSRPYAYVMRTLTDPGFDILSLADPSHPRVIHQWRIENKELHTGIGGSDGHYFKIQGRYYFVVSTQFSQTGPDHDLGAVVFDVNGLPDSATVKEVARIRTTDGGFGFGGFHTLYPYKHSDGRAVLFASSAFVPWVRVYDLAQVVSGSPGTLGQVPNGPSGTGGYHDMYVAWDPAARMDKFYGAGAGGYHVYDVTQPERPRLITSITGYAGMVGGHTVQVSPDGRYAFTQQEVQYAPVRIFDLEPGLTGKASAITRPIGAWAANWKLASHNHELRWPYSFVASFEDGLQVVNLMDPANPYTVASYDTHSGSLLHGLSFASLPDFAAGKTEEGQTIFDGLWGTDVRNSDGLIVVSDFRTGFWAFKMDGFDGWNGHQWGVPNISSAQDWDNGPDGLRKTQKVSLGR